MSLPRLWRQLVTAVAMFFIAAHPVPVRAATSFSFYYGPDIPWEALGAFDVAVVEPGHVGASGWAHRLNPDTTVAAWADPTARAHSAAPVSR